MFKRKTETVASVLSGLTDTVDRLTALETERLGASEVAANEINRLSAEIRANDAEAARANLVAERLRELLGLN